jgi:hypothetical protein
MRTYMRTSEYRMAPRGVHDGWRIARRWLLQRRATLNWKQYHKEVFLRCETKLIIFCLFAALTTGAQSRTQHLPASDAEKMADALRAAPKFITDDATMDWPPRLSWVRAMMAPPLMSSCSGVSAV